MNSTVREDILKYISATTELTSLLYDLDLLPEQHDVGTHDDARMLILANWYRNKHDKTRQLQLSCH